MAGAIAAIIAFLAAAAAFFRHKATKAEVARRQELERRLAADQALQRANGLKTAIDLVKEHAAKAEAAAAAKHAHDAALAEAQLAQVDAAAAKGDQAVSDLLNERILAARGKK